MSFVLLLPEYSHLETIEAISRIYTHINICRLHVQKLVRAMLILSEYIIEHHVMDRLSLIWWRLHQCDRLVPIGCKEGSGLNPGVSLVRRLFLHECLILLGIVCHFDLRL